MNISMSEIAQLLPSSSSSASKQVQRNLVILLDWGVGWGGGGGQISLQKANYRYL